MHVEVIKISTYFTNYSGIGLVSVVLLMEITKFSIKILTL